jgi:hypothetical protein
MSGIKQLASALGLIAAAGCNQTVIQNSSYAVLVRAADDLGRPLADVQLSAAGQALGATDARGQRALSMPGVEGQRVDLVASCPPSYTGPRERPAFLLKRVRNPQGSTGDQPIEVNVTCDSTNHVALVAVHTGQANLPIMLRGQVVAQTSELGTAHVMLREPVGNALQLTLDTSARPELSPANPTRMVTVTHQDAFSVWDQPFELEKRAASGAQRAKRGKKRVPVTSLPPPAPGSESKHKSERSR